MPKLVTPFVVIDGSVVITVPLVMRYGFGEVIVAGVPNLLGVGGGVIDGVGVGGGVIDGVGVGGGVIDGVGVIGGGGVEFLSAIRIGFELAF